MYCKRTVFTLIVTIHTSLYILMAQTPCSVGGMAGIYPCNNIDLMATMNIAALHTGDPTGVEGNDIWGWTSPTTGKEYALVGLTDGTSFVDVSTPASPILIGYLPGAASNTSWRDIKVVNNYAYIGSDTGPATGHNMQTFELAQLDNAVGIPVTFTASGTAAIGTSGRSHNIFADPEAGYVGACGGSVPSGGMAFYDPSTPANPSFTGNFVAPSGVNAYTHDAVCVVYRGADTEHIGKQICFGFNANILVAVDVTDKTSPTLIGTMTYAPIGYTHQGWITDDHNYIYLNDETDERNFGNNTRTHIIDIADLENMMDLTPFENTTAAIDHNLYIKGNYMYQSNYRAGLRIFDIQNRLQPNISEVAFFDVYPNDDANLFNGAWSVYPYFKSGTIVVNSIEDGLFVLQPTSVLEHFAMDHSSNSVQTVIQGNTATYNIDLTAYYGFGSSVGFSVTGEPAGTTATVSSSGMPNGSATVTVTTTASATPGNYQLILTGTTGVTDETESISMGLIINAVLPVELINFTANAKRDAIHLNWETATESLNKGFEIQRSIKNTPNEFEAIGWVDGQGNSEVVQSYFYEDDAVKTGITYYYRLRQVDEDGTEAFSKIVQAKIESFEQMVDIFPNPVNDFLNVRFDAFDFPIQNVAMSVVNVNGQVLRQEKLEIPAGEINYELNTQALSEGIYILRFVVDGEEFMKRFVKM